MQSSRRCSRTAGAGELAALVAALLLAAGLAAAQAAEDPSLLPRVVEEVEPTVVDFGEEDYPDPLESLNRGIFAMNDVVYRWALIPLSEAWLEYVPEPAREGTANFFGNLGEPLDAANHLLQGEWRAAADNTGRFLINTTIGVLGVFDAADRLFAIEEVDTTLNDTLRRWGVGTGPYLVVPLLGPSDLRRGFSGVAQSAASPIRVVAEDPEAALLIAGDSFQSNVFKFSAYRELREQSEDPYLYFRNQYLQGVRRDEEAGSAPD